MASKASKKVFFKTVFKGYVRHIFETVTMCWNKPHLLNNNSVLKFIFNCIFIYTAQSVRWHNQIFGYKT